MDNLANDYLELRKVVASTLKWLWLVILVTVVAAAVGYGISRRQPRVYAATATIMVGDFMQATEVSRTDLLTSEVLAQTYADMALRQPVLQAVIDTLDLSATRRELRQRIHVDLVEGTHLLEIEAEARSPEQAQAIADEVAQQLILLSPTAIQNQPEAEPREFVSQRLASLQAKIERAQIRLNGLENALLQSQSTQQDLELQTTINTLEGLISSWESNYIQMLMYIESGSSSNSLMIIEPAQLNPRPVRPRTTLNTILAGAIGLVLSLGFAILLEFWNDKFETANDVSLSLGLAALGTVNRMAGKDDRTKLLLFEDSASPATEAYRNIRSNLAFKVADQPVNTIVVTSPGPGEGKSTTVANLGIILAQADLRTIIVDADLRHPAQHDLFQLANSRGLAEAISSPEPDLSELIKDTPVRNLRVLPSGQVPSHPAELIGSRNMREILAQLSTMADVVICDSPPALGVSDAWLLAKRADGVVLVIEAGQTPLDAAKQAVSNLQQADANLLGAILNKEHRGRRAYYPYKRRTASSGLGATTWLTRLWQWLPF